jgi:hypothetical protein
MVKAGQREIIYKNIATLKETGFISAGSLQAPGLFQV